jgi:hypothetical protein
MPDPQADAGRLLALAEAIAERLPVPAIDQLWIFAPHRAVPESGVVVAAAYEDVPGRRRVVTAHFIGTRAPGGKVTTRLHVAEHGSAPADRLGRLVEGVLRRLDGALAAVQPRAVSIEGSEERWAALLASLRDAGPAAPRPPRDAPP